MKKANFFLKNPWQILQNVVIYKSCLNRQSVKESERGKNLKKGLTRASRCDRINRLSKKVRGGTGDREAEGACQKYTEYWGSGKKSPKKSIKSLDKVKVMWYNDKASPDKPKLSRDGTGAWKLNNTVKKEPTLKKPKGSRRKRIRTGGSFKRTKVRAEKSAKR